MARLRSVLVAALMLVPQSATGQQRDSMAVTAAELGAYLRFLSSDLLEGRYPGTRGEALTTAYLTSQLVAFGVRPGANDQWLQPVSITVHDSVADSQAEARVRGRLSRTLEPGRDIRLSNYSDRGEVANGGELVFVGYGIHAPMYGWDDFAGVDLKGRIAVVLPGEPNLSGDSVRFNGFRASRFSWTLDKFAELGKRGAVGVLLVRSAGAMVRGAPTGARRLAQDAANESVGFVGNIADSALAGLLPPRSAPLSALIGNAGRSGFRPVPLDLRLDVRFRTKPRSITTNNVVGVVPGTDPVLSREHVILSAHWDAFGVGAAVNGDSIYNGALDDGSGVSITLALARVFARHPQPRSLTFLFTTAEELGLLGAEAFARRGPLPPDRIAANLNIDDGFELYGVRRDVAPLGIELSSLGRTASDIAARMGLRVTPDPMPQEGFFLRADNFPFARVGVPALYMALGTDAVGRPAGWIDGKNKEYLDQHYHKPSDDYETVVVDLEGSRQLADFIREVTVSVATARERPQWLPGSEFQRPPQP